MVAETRGCDEECTWCARCACFHGIDSPPTASNPRYIPEIRFTVLMDHRIVTHVKLSQAETVPFIDCFVIAFVVCIRDCRVHSLSFSVNWNASSLLDTRHESFKSRLRNPKGFMRILETAKGLSGVIVLALHRNSVACK